VAKVALEGAKRGTRAAQPFAGCAWRMSPTLFFHPRGLGVCGLAVPCSHPWAGEELPAWLQLAEHPGHPLCLSRDLYKSKPMFPFKLTKAENGAREALWPRSPGPWKLQALYSAFPLDVLAVGRCWL